MEGDLWRGFYSHGGARSMEGFVSHGEVWTPVLGVSIPCLYPWFGSPWRDLDPMEGFGSPWRGLDPTEGWDPCFGGLYPYGEVFIPMERFISPWRVCTSWRSLDPCFGVWIPWRGSIHGGVWIPMEGFGSPRRGLDPHGEVYIPVLGLVSHGEVSIPMERSLSQQVGRGGRSRLISSVISCDWAPGAGCNADAAGGGQWGYLSPLMTEEQRSQSSFKALIPLDGLI